MRAGATHRGGLGEALAALVLLWSAVVGTIATGTPRTAHATGPGAASGWTPTQKSMSAARALHTATLLPNGRVLVTGGETAGGAITNSAELYDPGTDAWTSAGTMCMRREKHTATLLGDGTVLVAGGDNSDAGNPNVAVRSWELYDYRAGPRGAWTCPQGRDMGSARTQHSATLLQPGRPDSKVLVVGGYAGTGADSNPVSANAPPEIYDPATGLWTATGDQIERTWGHTANLLAGGEVLVAGGSGRNLLSGSQSGTGTRTSEVYLAATWAATAPLTTARVDHAAAVTGPGRLIVTGGIDTNGSPTRSVEVWDGVRWIPGASLAAARASHTATTLRDGRVLVTGGGSDVYGSNARGDSELYDPAAGSAVSGAWTPGDPLDGCAPSPSCLGRAEHTATLLSGPGCAGRCGSVLVTGGRTAAGRVTNTAELFTPPAPRAVIDPLSISFGAHLVGVAASQTATLSNQGSARLTISGIATGGAGFAQHNDCGGSLQAGARCTITVTCTPPSAGPLRGVLTVADNDPGGGVQQVSLSGIGSTVAVQPVVTGVSPSRGPTRGGTLVTVVGAGLGGVTRVTFDPQDGSGGGRLALGVVADAQTPDTRVVVTSPAGSGIADIRVTTPEGTSARALADLFTYVDPPTDFRTTREVVADGGPGAGNAPAHLTPPGAAAPPGGTGSAGGGGLGGPPATAHGGFSVPPPGPSLHGSPAINPGGQPAVPALGSVGVPPNPMPAPDPSVQPQPAAGTEAERRAPGTVWLALGAGSATGFVCCGVGRARRRRPLPAVRLA